MEKKHQYLVDKMIKSKTFNKNVKPNYYSYHLSNSEIKDFNESDFEVPYEYYNIKVFVLPKDKFKIEFFVQEISVYEKEVEGYELTMRLVNLMMRDLAKQIIEKKCFNFIKFKKGGGIKCKKDEGVSIMLETGGSIFEDKLWNNVTKRSMAKGGSLESELPSDTEQLVKEGKVTYRGMGFGASGVKLKVKGKEYIVSDEKFKALGGISKIKFDAPFRQFGKGTTIEGSEVSLHLPVEMSVYVPSTKDANVPVSKSELLKRVNEVKEYLANLFGGYSSSEVVGGYASNEGSLIQEDVVKVISFATKKAYEENKQKLINKIAKWSTLWSQEAIGFELEGDLYYINQDKKMGLGGALALTGLGILGYMAFIKKGKKETKSSAEYRVDIYEKGKIRNTMIVKEFQIDGVKEDYDKLGYKTKFTKLEKLAKGGTTDCGCHKKMSKGGNTDCGCWHYEIGGL